MRRRYALAVFLMVALSAETATAHAQSGPQPGSAEYQVYEAVLGLIDHIPAPDPHVTIYDTTLNSLCGEAAYPAPLANGCTFLWMKPDTPATIEQMLRQDYPDLDSSTWADFVTKNAASVRLHEPIVTPWKHELVGVGGNPSKEFENPDITLFLSRVGFNQTGTEAVVYVLTFSYLKQLSTEGDYFVFRKEKSGRWEPHDRLTYFTK